MDIPRANGQTGKWKRQAARRRRQRRRVGTRREGGRAEGVGCRQAVRSWRPGWDLGGGPRWAGGEWLLVVVVVVVVLMLLPW